MNNMDIEREEMFPMEALCIKDRDKLIGAKMTHTLHHKILTGYHNQLLCHNRPSPNFVATVASSPPSESTITMNFNVMEDLSTSTDYRIKHILA